MLIVLYLLREMYLFFILSFHQPNEHLNIEEKIIYKIAPCLKILKLSLSIL